MSDVFSITQATFTNTQFRPGESGSDPFSNSPGWGNEPMTTRLASKVLATVAPWLPLALFSVTGWQSGVMIVI